MTDLTSRLFPMDAKIRKSVKKKIPEASAGQTLYCICRKPDNGRWMIGCDFCDDWFHGECVGMNEDKARLVIKYACPRCRTKDPGTWKRKCRLPSCNEPVGATSKYCCHDHGVQFIKGLVSAGLAGVTKSQLARLVQVDSVEKFRKLGSSNPADSSDKNDEVDASEKKSLNDKIDHQRSKDHGENDSTISKLLDEFDSVDHDKALCTRNEYNRITTNRQRLNKRIIYLRQIKDRIKRINEELAQELGLKKKDICGLDSALMTEAWLESDPFTHDRANFCVNDRKKCLKHTNWHNIMMSEVGLELNNLRQEQEKLVRQVRDSLLYHREREMIG